jgi:peptidoglycan/LPS O-acetylase OafA/YrhL
MVRFHGLQVLRFVAAFSVVLFHAGAYSRLILGWNSPFIELISHPALGSAVFLFFTLSGFVIAHSLTTLPPSRFLLLRAIRLYPAYWLAVGLALAVRYSIWRVTSNFGFGSFCYGLLLLPTRTDCFVLGVEWSLVFEVAFYVILGLLAFGGRRTIAVGTAVWLATCLARLFFDRGGSANPLPGWTGILTSTDNLYFISGVVTYYLRDRGNTLRAWTPLVAPPILIATYVTQNALVIHLSQIVGYALVVWYLAGSKRWQSSDALVRYGDATYGLYLIHSPIIVVFDTLARDQFSRTPSDTLIVFSAALAVAIGAMFGVAELAVYRSLRRWVSGDKRGATAAPTSRIRLAA